MIYKLFIVTFYYRVKWFIQRGQRGYADCDVWSLHDYLSDWLPKALRQLEHTTHGYPVGMTAKEWSNKLKAIWEGFEAAKEIGNLPSLKHYKRLKQTKNKGLRMFNAYFFDLWD